MKKIKHILVAITVMSLSGCDEAINTVKSSRLNYNDTFTIDEAFSNRKVCRKIIWELIKDDRDRELVQYKCEVKGTKAYYKIVRETERAKINQFLTGQRQTSEYNIQYAKEQVNKREEFLKKARSNPQKTLDSSRLVELESLKELMSSDSPTTRLNLRHYFWTHGKPAIAEMIEDYEKEDRWIRLNGKTGSISSQRQATFDYLKENLDSALLDELKIIKQKIKEEMDRLEAINQKNLKDHLSNSESELKSAQNYYSQTIEKENKSRKEFEEKAVQELEKLDKRPNVVTVYEIFQWVVKQDEIEIVGYALEQIYENGKIEQRKSDPNSILARNALARVYQNKLENLSEMQNILW